MLIRNIALIGFLSAVFLGVNAHAQGQGDSVITVPGVPVGATVSLGGTVVPIKDVTFSAQIPGRIKSIAGEEGDFFEEGAELIAINDDDLLAKRRAAWANLANSEAALRNAGVQYSREWISPYGGEQNDAMGGLGSMMKSFTNPMQGMVGSGSSPGYDRYAQRYQYGTQLEQARSQLAAARASIEEIDTKIRDAKSVAPFKGVITKKLVEVGDPVQPGQPLLKFADMSQLQIKVEVPARLMPGVKKGMVFPARLDVGDIDIQARVVQIFPIADPDRHTVTVKLELPPGVPGGAGMYAEVMITDVNAKVRDLPVVPKSALVWRGSLPGIYVMNEQNKRELRLVRTGDEVGVDGIAILSGLRVGERVFVKGVESRGSDSGNSWN
ncbi:MAG: efflux RND transporter periplasmic adaptor subunit [Gammaproteobacteria bacterium]|nr:efflux RND transporter periplasmic adaptor subunit [Gammaproteobacteria bacterium]